MKCYLIVWLLVQVCANNAPEVEIKQGKLKGKFMKTRNGKDIMGFLGIPYAKPPINDLRFKDPIPVDSWRETRKADQDGPICPQRDIFTNLANSAKGDEDCLYLNVYTSKLSKSDFPTLPVMVFLHGGGFILGSGNSLVFGPDYLLDHDVVLVVPNYRLGALGFITTGDDVVPGNIGLKDQVLALKWIQENIVQFGGDPNSVTLFGQSSGGCSAHYHVMSPLSNGLFHRAISQSGTSIDPWAIDQEGQTKRNTDTLAKSFNCSTENTEKTIACLRSIDAKELAGNLELFLEWDIDPLVPYKPVVEHKHPNAFLSEHPQEIMKQGKENPVPLILGITSNEGCIRTATLFTKPKILEEFFNDFDKVVPISLLYEQSNDVENITKRIKEFYFKNKVIGNNTIQEIINMYTDAWYLEGLINSAKLHFTHAKTPVYLYYFDYKGRASTSMVFADPKDNYGVCHGDELFYLFKYLNIMISQPIPEDDKKVIEIMTELWTNFAQTGKPTLNNKESWKPVSTENIEYLHIKNDNDIKMNTNFLKDRFDFWDSLQIRKNTVIH